MRWRRENDFDTDIRKARVAFPQVPVSVIKAIIGQESAFNPKAHREEPRIGDASRGLMQLLWRTAQAEGYAGTKDNLLLPAINIYYGTKHLAGLFSRLGNWTNVWSAYNGGIRPDLAFGSKNTRQGLRCMGRVIPIGEYCNQGYVDSVQELVRYFAHDRATGEGPIVSPAKPGGAAVGVLLALAAAAYGLTR